MGIFRRKSKKKNRVSFEEDVGVNVSSSLPNTNETIEAIKNDPLNNKDCVINNSNSNSKSNSATSSSSSSRKDHIERRGKEEQKQVVSSSVSLCSDIESDHQRNSINNEGEDEDEDESNGSDYLNDSQDIDFIDDSYKMTADCNEENFDAKAAKAYGNVNEVTQNNNINNKSRGDNNSTRVIQTTPALEEDEINQSGRMDDHDRGRHPNPDAANMTALIIENNDNISNSTGNSNSTATKKAEGNLSPRKKGNSNVNRSQVISTTSTISGSMASVKEQQPDYQQQFLQHEYNSERTRDLVKVFIGEIWNRGEIESIERVCSPRLRFNGHTGLERVGHEGFSRMVTTVRSSLEGYHCEIHSMVVEGRKCFCRLKFTGKHVGELMGYPPTRKLVAWMGASEFTICPRRNQILKVWELGDIKTLEAQLMD